jgi:hypothetical protein
MNEHQRELYPLSVVDVGRISAATEHKLTVLERHTADPSH